MVVATTLFKDNLLTWWNNLVQYAHAKLQFSDEFSRMSALSKAILDTFFPRDRHGDAHVAYIAFVKDRRVCSTTTRKWLTSCENTLRRLVMLCLHRYIKGLADADLAYELRLQCDHGARRDAL